MADDAYAPDPTKDHETVSIYPLDDDVKEELLNTVGEAVLNWSTKDGWPVGVMHAVVWAKGSFWMTAAAHRHRMAALRRDPRCSVVLTSTGTHLGPGKTITAKCRCVMYEDRETKDWFYHALAFRPGPTPSRRPPSRSPSTRPCASSWSSCRRSGSPSMAPRWAWPPPASFRTSRRAPCSAPTPSASRRSSRPAASPDARADRLAEGAAGEV